MCTIGFKKTLQFLRDNCLSCFTFNYYVSDLLRLTPNILLSNFYQPAVYQFHGRYLCVRAQRCIRPSVAPPGLEPPHVPAPQMRVDSDPTVVKWISRNV